MCCPLRADPSVERTSFITHRLLGAAAHVKLQGLPFEIKR